MDILLRLRASSTDATTAYADIVTLNSGAALSAENNSSAISFIRAASTARNHGVIDILNPFSAERSGFLGMGAGSHGYGNANQSRHNTSSSYDGFSLIVGSGTMTGTITLYGYEA